MKNLISSFIFCSLFPVVGFSASGTSDDLEVLSQEAQKFLGTWEGEVKFDNEHRQWITKRKRDYSAEYDFKVCNDDGENCKQWKEVGGWNVDQNYFYSIYSIDKDGNIEGHVYKYTILENNCIEFLQVASSYKEFVGNNGKEYDSDDLVNKYKFQDCKVN